MRVIARIVLIAAVVVVIVIAGGYLYVRQSLPQLDGTVAVVGLERPVKITRDREGIPHIMAASSADAYFGLGFVHAQDRLWQMEASRRIGAGRLSEVLGADAIDYDKFLRTLGAYRHAERTYAHLSARHTRRARCLQRRRQRVSGQPRGSVAARVHYLEPHTRAVATGRFPGLGQGDGVQPRRQHVAGTPARAHGSDSAAREHCRILAGLSGRWTLTPR